MILTAKLFVQLRKFKLFIIIIKNKGVSTTQLFIDLLCANAFADIYTFDVRDTCDRGSVRYILQNMLSADTLAKLCKYTTYVSPFALLSRIA